MARLAARYSERADGIRVAPASGRPNGAGRTPTRQPAGRRRYINTALNICRLTQNTKTCSSLRIDRTARTGGEGEPPVWARRYILVGIAVLVLLGIVAMAYRLFSHDAPEVEVVRASAQSSDVGGVVLSASGYIVAHHKINLNSKVTGRVKWIGVEKGDKVKEGQILVRLEDDEFRAQYEQAKGAAENARAYLARTAERISSRGNSAGPAQSG